jgi:hypothetical protein
MKMEGQMDKISAENKGLTQKLVNKEVIFI